MREEEKSMQDFEALHSISSDESDEEQVDKLSLKELTLKVVVLISSVSVQRGETIHLLSIDHMVPMNNCYSFQIVDH